MLVAGRTAPCFALSESGAETKRDVGAPNTDQRRRSLNHTRHALFCTTHKQQHCQIRHLLLQGAIEH